MLEDKSILEALEMLLCCVRRTIRGEDGLLYMFLLTHLAIL